jgi:hypothetical protein
MDDCGIAAAGEVLKYTLGREATRGSAHVDWGSFGTLRITRAIEKVEARPDPTAILHGNAAAQPSVNRTLVRLEHPCKVPDADIPYSRLVHLSIDYGVLSHMPHSSIISVLSIGGVARWLNAQPSRL